MNFNGNDNLRSTTALVPQVIASAATFTGPIIDTKDVREILLTIHVGAFTVNALTAANVQLFADDKNDLSAEAQAGSSVDIFLSIAANAVIYVRALVENTKRFVRFKFVTTGNPTTLAVCFNAATLQDKYKGALVTLAGTITP